MIVWLALSGVAAAGVLAWHMRRRRETPLALSFARFLPEPPSAPSQARRLALTLPMRSAAFWLRMLALAAALSIFALLPLRLPLPGTAGTGVLMVLDAGDSMRIGQGAGTRLDQAFDAALALPGDLDALGAPRPPCIEILAVGETISAPAPLGEARKPAPEAAGVDAARLLAASGATSPRCRFSHVLILSDAPAPAGLARASATGRRIAWRGLGEPRGNVGLRRAALERPGLGGGEARIQLRAERYGDAPEPRVVLSGPGGAFEVAMEPEPGPGGGWRGDAPTQGPGAYLASLSAPDGYDGDDRLSFVVPAETGALVDWRLEGVGRPRGLAEARRSPPAAGAPTESAGTDAAGQGASPAGPGPAEATPTVVVAPLASADAATLAGPALLTWPGWRSGGEARRIGSFLEDPMLGAVNLDVFEAHAPTPLPVPLPAGFAPVAVELGGGGVFLARRVSPPGLIVPAPVVTAGADVAALSLTIFYTALSELVRPAPQTLTPAWQGRDGRAVVDAWRESDQAREPVAPPSLAAWLASRPGEAPARQDPALASGASAASETGEALWPWVALLALLVLAAERAWAAWTGGRRRTDAL